MLWSRYDVFLSYSRADAERVQPLLDELRRLGYRVFFDVQSIAPGEQWKKRLDRSIRGSRTLVLCWSEHAHGSDYIAFEYSRAEALHKPVFPWLLDRTPLPAMLEIQGINEPDGIKVAAALRPYLGWRLTRRHFVQAVVALLIAIAIAIPVWRKLNPPPPPAWGFQGQVTGLKTGLPISGVEVTLKLEDSKPHVALTDSHGVYTLQNLPAPRPDHIHLEFRKSGFAPEGDTISSSKTDFDPRLQEQP
ncbi:MAG: TIR domain-containing protein [Terracidiphilus sp.]|jgi:hypothetical protein